MAEMEQQSSLAEIVPVHAAAHDAEHHAEAQRPKRGPRGQVVIFGTWCKGCGLCVEFCPRHVLALNDDGHPVVAAPERCTACHWCDTHCPDFAIVVERLA